MSEDAKIIYMIARSPLITKEQSLEEIDKKLNEITQPIHEYLDGMNVPRHDGAGTLTPLARLKYYLDLIEWARS